MASFGLAPDVATCSRGSRPRSRRAFPWSAGCHVVQAGAASAAPDARERPLRPYVHPRSRRAEDGRRHTIAEIAYEAVDWSPSRRCAHRPRSMTNTSCNRSAFPARSRIRPSSCNRPPWPRSRRRSRAIDRICRRNRHVGPALGRAVGKRHLCRRGAWLTSPGRLERRRNLRQHLGGRGDGRRTPSVFVAAGFWATARGGQGPPGRGIVLDNWLKGRRRAVWVSKSDKLLEDAQRDWSAWVKNASW